MITSDVRQPPRVKVEGNCDKHHTSTITPFVVLNEVACTLQSRAQFDLSEIEVFNVRNIGLSQHLTTRLENTYLLDDMDVFLKLSTVKHRN